MSLIEAVRRHHWLELFHIFTCIIIINVYIVNAFDNITVDIRNKGEGAGRGRGWSVVVTGGQQAWT